MLEKYQTKTNDRMRKTTTDMHRIALNPLEAAIICPASYRVLPKQK